MNPMLEFVVFIITIEACLAVLMLAFLNGGLFVDPWDGANREHIIPNWMRGSLYPDFIIGGKDRPYIRRWYLVPRFPMWLRVTVAILGLWFHTPWLLLILFGGYLHNIRRSDDDRALHDHPVHNCSIVVVGGYVEVLPDWKKIPKGERVTPTTPVVRHPRLAGDIIFRRAQMPHRIEIGSRPAWTLWLIGPPVRQWGFLCAQGWRLWKDFVADDPGLPGRGCD